MANVASLVESRFLNGELLGSKPQILTIRKADIEELGDEKEPKCVVEFAEQEKPLACNKTQLRTLINLFGAETKAWAGKRIMALGRKLTSGQFAGRYTIELIETEQEAQQGEPEGNAVF